MKSILDLVTEPCTRDLCEAFLLHQRLSASQIARQFGSSMPEATEGLSFHGLIVRSGDSYLSTDALARSLILAEGVNSGDVDEVVSKLYALYPRLKKISIVRANVSRRFVEAITGLRTAGTIAICSPWIRLSDQEWRTLERLINSSALNGEPYSLMVVMRPPKTNDEFAELVERTIERFKAIGGEVITSARLHAKLYIRVPSASPGDELALVGSQNLTQTAYDELGIFIDNDRELVRDLHRAFFAIAEGR